MFASVLVIHPLEILILSHLGHGREDFSEALSFRAQQQFFKQGTMLGLRALAMPYSTLFEGIDNTLIEISDYETCHGYIYLSWWMIAMIALFRWLAINRWDISKGQTLRISKGHTLYH
jgi:hypothetical protein